MIRYVDDAAGITPEQLEGFFEGWPAHPSPTRHQQLLRGSDAVVLAIDSDGGNVVGFITAITDGVLAAYIPLLEVLPAWRGQGIGGELVRRLVERLRDFYMVDLVCDPELVSFYESLGFRRGTSANIRHWEKQAGVGGPGRPG